MAITHELSQNRLFFYLSGELDHHAAHDTISYLTQQITLNRCKSIELDFSGIAFMDSSGLAVAMNAKRLSERSGGSLKIRNVPPQAMKIFRAAALEKIILFV